MIGKIKLQDQKNVEIQWRIVRVLYNMSKEPKYETTYKKELVYQAYDIISNLIDSNKGHYAVHKWYALLLDAKSTYVGIKEKIMQLENVKKHMDVSFFMH